MPQENLFPHVKLLLREEGAAVLDRGNSRNDRVAANKLNRAAHSGSLRGKFDKLKQWAIDAQEAYERGEAQIIPKGVPFLMRIPENDGATIEFIAQKLGLEVVAEYDEGYLIVANETFDFSKVEKFIEMFAGGEFGATGMACLLEVDEDPMSQGRIDRLMTKDLRDKWPFPDDESFLLDVSIEVAIQGFPKKRRIGGRSSDEKKQQRDAEQEAISAQYYELWDQKKTEREISLEDFVRRNGGEIPRLTDDSNIVEFPDSFTARIMMSGRGFKDLVKNFPNIFEISEPEDLKNELASDLTAEEETTDAFKLIEPIANAPTICVMDTGIQEGHKWLNAAIDTSASKCFLPYKDSGNIADEVGHGTSVAGACLYPHSVPKSGTFQPPFKILNARILDEENNIRTDVAPYALMSEVVSHYYSSRGTRIFQHSVGSHGPYPLSRMSVWASTIDSLSYNFDILVIQAAGNLRPSGGPPTRPSIVDHLNQGRLQHEYQLLPSSRISNPAQSLQAITVGSIAKADFDDGLKQSIAKAMRPSSFSRTGFGLWNSIKPEVVEIGGDWLKDQSKPLTGLSLSDQVCPELIKSTAKGGPPIASDNVGTSFAAPKVAHIAGLLAAQFPNQPTLLYRALIVNSARWPEWAERLAVRHRPAAIRAIGYGVPDVSRATENTPCRITLITDKAYEIKAGEGLIFGVPVPLELRAAGSEDTIRVDVSLSYSAEPRRTRKSRRGYLGVWLDWRSSKKGEKFDSFCARALKDFDGEEGGDEKNMPWTLGNRMEKDGQTEGVCRKNGTIQKDWAYLRSFELPDSFGIIVRGHKGWDQANPNATATFSLAITFEVIGGSVEIYSKIEQAVRALEAEALSKVPRAEVR